MPLDWLDATATHSSRGKSAGLKPQTDPKAARGVAGDALGSHKKDREDSDPDVMPWPKPCAAKRYIAPHLIHSIYWVGTYARREH